MITGEYEQLQDMAKGNVCAADGGVLTVAWHKEKSVYYMKCGTCGEVKAITRVLSLTEEHKAGTLPDGPVKDNVERGIRKRAAQLPQAPRAETFSGIPATDLGTGELLPLEVLKGLVAYARKYDLDPARGHVVLMYSKPYITLDGYLYHAREVNAPYKLESRPLNDWERHDYQVEPGDYACLATVTKIVSGSTFSGVGIVTAVERAERSKKHPDQLAAPVVARHPWQLAQKRAEWQAMRRAFPIGESDKEVNDGQGQG